MRNRSTGLRGTVVPESLSLASPRRSHASQSVKNTVMIVLFDTCRMLLDAVECGPKAPEGASNRRLKSSGLGLFSLERPTVIRKWFVAMIGM